MFGRRKTVVSIGVIVLISIASGAVFQLTLDVGDFWQGFGAAALLFFLCFMAMYFVWRRAGGQRIIAWMMVTAFVIRIILGVFLAWGLPRFGYDEPPQRAGFVFFDPYIRENSAWDLAQSDKPLLDAFRDTYLGDQYGGMFALSAFIYRYISPDAFRPVLITILSAGASGLSLPFLVSALRRLLNVKSALIAGWIMVFYPESILLGASQMREPFLIMFIAIMIWSAVLWMKRSQLNVAISIFLASTLSLFLLSLRVAVPITGIFILFFWVHQSPNIKQKWVKYAVWAVFAVGLLLLSWLVIEWVDEVLRWDTLVTITRSGMIQALLTRVPYWLHFPFILIYGIFQPLLPAAVAAPAPWIWRGLAIFRSVGWYALLPLLIYASVRVWRMEPSQKRRLIRLIVFVVWAWILIASARAGGDQWNNPRYRTILLPLMATLSGWAVVFAQQTKDRWLRRGLLIEGIFLLFFSLWYIGRYYRVIPVINFWLMIGLIIILCSAVILTGWILDRKRLQEISFEDL